MATDQHPSASYYRELADVLKQAQDTLNVTERELRKISEFYEYGCARICDAMLHRARLEIDVIASWYERREAEEDKERNKRNK